MATRVPLLVIDEIMLPGASTEIGLEPRELRFLEQTDRAEGGAVAIAARAPGRPAPTALEQKATGTPGPLIEAALVGAAMVLPPEDDQPDARLAIEAPSRMRLVGVEVHGDHDGWWGELEPWPIAREGLDADGLQDRLQRFYRALLASSDGEPEALERPVEELGAIEDPLAALLLIADFLYERTDVRLALLTAPDATTIAGMVDDALELLEAGLPTNPRALRGALARWLGALSSARLMELGRAARVLSTLTAAVPDATGHADEAAAIAEALDALQGRVDRLAAKIAKGSGRRRR